MLDELERLLKDATPGPWVSFADEPDPLYCVASVAGVGVTEICREPQYDERIADMALIAAAVNALPALLRYARAGLWRRDAERNARATNAAIDAYDAAQVAQELDAARDEYAAALAALEAANAHP